MEYQAARAEHVSWQLAYADGRICTEPPGGGTIKESWAEPVELRLINKTGQVRFKLPIPRGASPIFYRRKSADYQFTATTGRHQSGQPIFMLGAGRLVFPKPQPEHQAALPPTSTTDVTVFGWATEDLLIEWKDAVKLDGKVEDETSGHLEAVVLIGNQAQIHNPCPKKWISQQAIEGLITRRW